MFNQFKSISNMGQNIMQYKQMTTYMMAACVLATPSHAQNIVPNAFTEAFKNGRPSIDFRIRHENAEQRNLDEAKATTLRSTLGYETAEFSHAKVKLELIDVANLLGQRYNPGVSDLSKPNYSTIADAKGAGITEGKLIYSGLEKNSFTFGRQYIILNNQRFISNNNFRQFPQSFDAFTISNTWIESLTMHYSFITHVNTNYANGRTPGGRRSLHTHLFNADWNGYRYGNLCGYVYLNEDRTIKSNSHAILGFQISAVEAETGSFDYTVELARQQGKFNNPNQYVAHYMLGKISKTIDLVTGSVGIERLSGSSTGTGKAFITPMGNYRDFNGLAQAFTTTPDRGLKDANASISVKYTDLTVFATYHYFRLDKGPGSKRAGREIDLGFDFKLNQEISLYTAYAKYTPKGFNLPKTMRFCVMLTANLL